MILRRTVATVIAMVSVPVLMLAALLTVWVADRDEPAVVDRVWLVPDVVKACDEIEVHVKRYMARHSGVRVERTMTDSTNERRQLAGTDLEENPGPFGDYAYYTTYQVPCTFNPGWAEYNAKTVYYRNPLQRYVWPIPGGRWKIRFCVIDDGGKPEQVCRKQSTDP